METELPLSSASCSMPMTTHDSEEKPMPAVMRRSAVGCQPKRCSEG